MKPKPSFEKTGVEGNPKPQNVNPKASGEYKLPDVPVDETDLQNLNVKIKEYPFSNYYKAKDNDPL